jgi:hypothetical protein
MVLLRPILHLARGRIGSDQSCPDVLVDRLGRQERFQEPLIALETRKGDSNLTERPHKGLVLLFNTAETVRARLAFYSVE